MAINDLGGVGATAVSQGRKLLMPSPDSVAQSMGRFRQGGRESAGQLVEMFYTELKQIAATRMRRESVLTLGSPRC